MTQRKSRVHLLLLFATLIVLLYSCQSKKYAVEISRERITETNAAGSRSLDLYKDSLMVFWESGFDNTPIQISVNGTIIKDTITTSNVGIADVKSLGLRSDIKSVSLSVDGGSNIIIEVDSHFKFFTINFNKDRVRIDLINMYPVYE